MLLSDTGLTELVESFRMSCSGKIFSNSKMLRPRQREPRLTMKDLLPLLRRKSPPTKKEPSVKRSLPRSNRPMDFNKCLDIIAEGPDGTPKLVGFLTGFRAKAIDEVRDSAGNGLLHVLILAGYRESLKYFKSMGCNMNEVNLCGFSGIALACRIADIGIVKYLIEVGGDPCIRSADGKTSLHWAVIGGAKDIVAYLLDHFPRIVDEKDNQGMTALHHAAGLGNPEMCRVLIQDGGARTDILDRNGLDPDVTGILQYRLNEWFRGASDISGEIVKKKGLKKDSLEEKIEYASLTQEMGIVNVLIGLGIDPSSADSSAQGASEIPGATTAIRNGREANRRMISSSSVEDLELAISDGGCVNTVDEISGLSPVHLAVLKGSEDMLRVLISRKADVNKESANKAGLTALHYAVVSDQGTACMRLLLEAGAHISQSILDACIGAGSVENLDLLVKKFGHNVIEDPHGLFFTASRTGKTDMCLYMMRHKVRADTPDEDGRNAFLIACVSGYTVTACSIGEESMKHAHGKHTVLAVDNANRTCVILLAACPACSFRGDPTSIERFLDLVCSAGLNIDHVDSSGNTALLHAAKVGNDLMCEILIRRGARADGADEKALKSGFFDLSLKIYEMRSLNKPTESKVSVGYLRSTANPGLGLNRDQNLEFLCQQMSTPLGLRLENIPSSMDSKSLADWLIKHGSRPAAVRVIFDPITSRPCRYAYACFSERVQMRNCIKLPNLQIGDRRVKLYIDESLLVGTAPVIPGMPDWIDHPGDETPRILNPADKRKTIRFAPT